MPCGLSGEFSLISWLFFTQFEVCICVKALLHFALFHSRFSRVFPRIYDTNMLVSKTRVKTQEKCKENARGIQNTCFYNTLCVGQKCESVAFCLHFACVLLAFCSQFAHVLLTSFTKTQIWALAIEKFKINNN